MKRIACCLLFTCWVLNAQAADNNWLEELKNLFHSFWAKQQPEKIALHTDRAFYAAGDTVWFKASLTDARNHELRLVPEVIYLNLISSEKKVVISQKLKPEMGYALGSLALPDSLPKGSYLLQANTNWQRNTGPGSFYQQVIFINAPDPGLNNTAAASLRKILKNLQFFPEGGKLLPGLDGKVGLKAVAEDGSGISAGGKVLDEAGKVVATFRCNNDGIGSFKIKPVANKSYVAQIVANSQTRNFPLPVLSNGYALNLKTQPDSVYINLATSGENKQAAIYMVAQSQGNLLVSDSVLFNPNGKRKIGYNTKNWPEGVTNIALLNAQGLPEAERVYFQNKKQPIQARLITSKRTYGRRETIALNIALQDESGKPVETEFSVSITGNSVTPAPSLRSSLLFTSEISGNVLFPDNYLANTQAMDDLLLIQSPRSFSWQVLKEKSYSTLVFPRETELKNQGIAMADSNTVGQAVIYLLDTQTGKTYIITSDAAGKFTLPGGNATRYFYQVWQNGLMRQNAKLRFINSEKILPTNNWELAFSQDSASASRFVLQQRIKNTYGLSASKENSTPANIANWLNYQPDKKYILEQYNEFATMEEIFREIVPSVRIINKKGIPQANMLNSDRKDFFSHQPLYIIDGQPTWNSDLFLRFDATQVKQVDVYYSSKTLTPFGFLGNQGVIAIQTKNGNYQSPELNTEQILNVPGQQATSQFKAGNIPANIPDFRPTLYWNPGVKTNSEGKATINFQTSDEMGNLRVQVEGITKNGKIISEQLLIPVQPAE